ncbi:deoxynucleoside triphosphate triphosphohydrolase SAMHD1 isoform X3 [Cimex lectularius]|uniref:HD domain-containing protein n=1 Tax=Cimex lectularius TaxID=79782 RepID=A0A8I6RAK7_CIMLE|nr:deoxynucleoside triphosphate triphosphohydrolase SAMHD1 isoform X3 [Cimex lectularius]
MSTTVEYGSDIACCRMAGAQYTGIRDAVIGQVEIHEVCKAIVDTEEFQRLRFIAQCGFGKFVFPTANHTRFEHSLGVCHMAKLILDCLEKNLDDDVVVITKEDKLCVQIAALCHDLGHGPFSHFWEHFLKEKFDKTFIHEEMSEKLLDRIYENHEKVRNVFKKHNLGREELEIAKRMIRGVLPEDKTKNYLYEIVSNKISGVDVDKLEYLQRDSHQFGMNCFVAIDYLLSTAKIIKLPDGTTTIAYREKTTYNLLGMFLNRAEMHHRCYQHPVTLAIELMFSGALKQAADNDFGIDYKENGQVKRRKIDECHNHLNEYIKLTDDIFMNIYNSLSDSLHEARHILKRILHRNIYVLVLKENITKEMNFTDMNYNKLKTIVENSLLKELNNKYNGQYEFHCKIVVINMGGTSDNPLKNIHFYNKHNEITHQDNYLDARFYSKDSNFVSKVCFIFCDFGGTQKPSDDTIQAIKKQCREEFDKTFQRKSHVNSFISSTK